MAAKKKAAPKRKMPKITVVHTHETLTDAQAQHNEACQLKIDGHMAFLQTDDEARRFLSCLLHNYERVCLMLVNARTTLEHPSVAHAVVMVKQLQELEAKIEEVKDKLNSHALYDDHGCCNRDKYY